jgi:hypothetical protein
MERKPQAALMENHPLTSPLPPGERKRRERWFRRSHELADRFKNHPGLLVVFHFHIFQLSQKLFVGGDLPTQSYKSPHDKNIHFDSTVTLEDTRPVKYDLSR